jgi:hypothetical protein
MNTNRYSRHFYSTPHYTPTEQAAPIFAVKSLHVLPRHPHGRRAIGVGHRNSGARAGRIPEPVA